LTRRGLLADPAFAVQRDPAFAVQRDPAFAVQRELVTVA